MGAKPSGPAFDLERVRQNFNRTPDAEAHAVQPRFAFVEAPRDAYEEAREIFTSVRRDALALLPDCQGSLSPLFDKAERALVKMEAGEKVQEEFLSTLRDLEDLCAVFLRLWG